MRPHKENRMHVVGDGSVWIFLDGKHGGIAEVDEADIPNIRFIHWHAHKSSTGTTYYAIGRSPRVKGYEMVKMHRILLGLKNPKLFADHKDRNGLNNRRSNLRLANRSQNNANSFRLNHSSIYRGVYPMARRWCAKIGRHYIGSFSDQESAARAYDIAASAKFGEFSVLNFPDERPDL